MKTDNCSTEKVGQASRLSHLPFGRCQRQAGRLSYSDRPVAAVVGDNCIDCYRGETERWYPGGNAVNVGVHLQRAGVPTAYLGVVGDDEEGKFLESALTEEGIDLRWIDRRPGRTGRTFVRLERGERVFEGDDPGVQSPLALNATHLAVLKKCSLVHFSGFTSWEGNADRHQPNLVVEMASLQGRPRLSLDFSGGGDALFRRVGSVLNYSFFSRADLSDKQVHEFVEQCLEIASGIVVVTRGARGCAAGQRGCGLCMVPAQAVEVVDTLGAGDAFIAGFLAATLQGKGFVAALAGGSRCAAGVLSSYGAWTNAVVDTSARHRSVISALEGRLHPISIP